LKLKCDEALSNVAFNFNLRRYTAGADAEMIGAMRALLGLHPGKAVQVDP
jgi:hypothetical protein